jgi:SAM-dependent methyltransferase
MSDNKQKRSTFDQVALLYDEARPRYPEALFEDIITLSRIPPDGCILEVGCGTGQASLPFARRNYVIHCVELGANLADVAQRNLLSYPNAKVTVGNFETLPIESESYNLLMSATAFHWIDPAIRYKKTYNILKPNGAIALFWSKTVQTGASADFFEAVQKVYHQIAPNMAKQYLGLSHPDNMPTPVKDEIESSGLFKDVKVRKHLWTVNYDATTYINLLNTYSDHRSLDDITRTHLFRDIAYLINTQFDGSITKEYLAILYLAHRK